MGVCELMAEYIYYRYDTVLVNQRFGGSVQLLLRVYLDAATVYQNIESSIIAIALGGGSDDFLVWVVKVMLVAPVASS